MDQEDLKDFRRAIDSYRVTVVVMAGVIVIVCAIFALVMLVSVPHVLTSTLDDYYNRVEFKITE